WEAFRAARQAYHAQLNELGLWDRHAARLVAVEQREIKCDSEIVLLGMVDLNRVVRLMLAQVADRVTALVVAPRDCAERFGPYGELDVPRWKSTPVPLIDEQLYFVDGPVEQAAAAVDWLAGLGGTYAVEDVAIGVPDAALAPVLRRRLARAG